ncbi:unnamed protein product [Rotaria sordida]|uniref:Beta-lactamase-related domain-containing protein n=1 Tax=Rotaria sordida TaxID=392033 RepID=A0A815CPR0_9BILA|nr:unnamed protein product [Rotaria sordida]CAF1307531.1 unnamed protein product [Rotaria sordida]
MWLTVICWLSCISLAISADVNLYGSTANGWEFVRDLFRENFVQGRDTGGSIAIYHQGRLVVDLAGGWFDASKTKVYDNETLQLVFSTSKGLVAIAAALCVQRGLLDYSAPVTRYWPEYGQRGKENTTVADILSHRAGVPNVLISSFDQYLNWTTMIDLLEQERPVWIPGHAQGYHALTYGWLAGELIRRVDPQKRTIGEFIREEIADPIQTEFYIGLPQEFEQRVSPLILTDVEGILNSSMLTVFRFYNEAQTHQAEIPAANGITNARSLARIFASLIGNINDRKDSRLLQPEILQHATTSNTLPNETDIILQISLPFGMGFALYEQDFPMFGPKSFGHSGKIDL